MSGGAADSVTFAGAGTLQLDDSVHFGGLVAGFGVPDMLDLRDITFVSGTTTFNWTQSGTSGTLMVSDNAGHTANITLLGQYMTENFKIATDEHGGTLVTDPPVSATTDPLALTNPHY
jgi:hypothetical protein